MWTFGELKQNAKNAIRTNYWKSVLVSFLAFLFSGGVYSVAGRSGGNYGGSPETTGITLQPEVFVRYIIGIFAASLALLLIGTIVGLFYKSFLADFIEMGTAKFFLNNRIGKAEVSDMLKVFSADYYKKNAWINFEKNVSIMLWSLLLVIPGIIKSLELSMVPYILAEQPHLMKEEAFQLSKELTDGNKMKIFMFGLSFFFWILLSGLTAGFAYIFWVGPYMEASFAELYKQLVSDYQNRR